MQPTVFTLRLTNGNCVDISGILNGWLRFPDLTKQKKTGFLCCLGCCINRWYAWLTDRTHDILDAGDDACVDEGGRMRPDGVAAVALLLCSAASAQRINPPA
ncbi:hypothetical protein BaRGS_00007971, partial [Batillaria attramentaria]